jgi:hypothetical protein
MVCPVRGLTNLAVRAGVTEDFFAEVEGLGLPS